MYSNPPQMIWIFIEGLVIGWPRAECIIQALEPCRDTMWHHIGICFATQNGHHVQTVLRQFISNVCLMPCSTVCLRQYASRTCACIHSHQRISTAFGRVFGCIGCCGKMWETSLTDLLCLKLGCSMQGWVVHFSLAAPINKGLHPSLQTSGYVKICKRNSPPFPAEIKLLQAYDDQLR